MSHCTVQFILLASLPQVRPSCPYKSRDCEQTCPQLLEVFHLSGGGAFDSWILDFGDGMHFNVFQIDTSKTDKFN